MSWFNVREIRIRHHQKADRPANLMVVYELEGHPDCLDFLAFDSPKPFAREKASSRWLELMGEEQVPTTTEEALSREEELQAPLRIFVVQDGRERASEVSYEEAPEVDPSLEADRQFLNQGGSEPKSKQPVPNVGQFDFSKFKAVLLLAAALLAGAPLHAKAHFVSPEWMQVAPQLPPDRYRIADCDPTAPDCFDSPMPCTWWAWDDKRHPPARLWELEPR